MAETLEDLHIHLLRRKTDSFPFVLQGNHFLGLVFPGRECFQFIILNRFNDFADDGLFDPNYAVRLLSTIRSAADGGG